MSENDIPAWITPGAKVQWDTWCGPSSVHTISLVSRFRVSTVEGMWWEASCFKSLAASLAATRGIRPVAA